MKEDYQFVRNINDTGETGIIILSNPPKLLCYCSEENSKTILKALSTNPIRK